MRMIRRLNIVAIILTSLRFFERIGFCLISLPVRDHFGPLGYRAVIEGLVMIIECFTMDFLHFYGQIESRSKRQPWKTC